MMYPDDPCLGIPTEDWSASPLPLSPPSSSTSLNDLTQSVSSQFLPSLCSSRTSCSDVSFDLDPTPSCSELSQLSGRSYHGSPEASFLYPDYPSFVFNSSHFRASPGSSSTNLSPRCIESGSGLDDKLRHATSSTSLLSVHQSESSISAGAESVITFSSSDSVILVNNSESIISITSSRSVISVASSSSCHETLSHALINPVHPSGYKPVSLRTLFYHDLPYYQWTSFSNPASPSTSFTDLILPNTSVSCSETPLTENPSFSFSSVPGSASVIRDLMKRKRKRYDDDDGLPSKRQCQ